MVETNKHSSASQQQIYNEYWGKHNHTPRSMHTALTYTNPVWLTHERCPRYDGVLVLLLSTQASSRNNKFIAQMANATININAEN